MPPGDSPRIEAVPEPTAPDSAWPYIGVGCLTLVVGFFGGGMIAVLIGKIVGGFTGCRPEEGLPVCFWWRYVLIGGLVGGIGLPSVAIFRMRRGRSRPPASGETR